MKRYFTLILVLLLVAAGPLKAGSEKPPMEQTDTVMEKLLTNMREQFNTEDRKALIEACKEYKAYNLEIGNLYNYYQGWQTEVMYDINHNNFYRAMKNAIAMSKDIQEHKCTEAYYLGSYLMGIIYSLRENRTLARQYFNKALEEVDHSEPQKVFTIYLDLANVEMDDNPQEAMDHIDHAIDIIKGDKYKYQYSDAMAFKVIVAFMTNDKTTLNKCYQHYMKMKDEYGKEFSTTFYNYVMLCKYAADGQYKKALKQTELLTNTDKQRFKILIYEMAGDTSKAYKEQSAYMHIKDSVNNEIMGKELTDAANDIDIATMRNKAYKAKMTEAIMLLAIIFSVVTIAALALYITLRHRYTKDLKNKKRELEIARDKTEEAERMKANFIKNMSHEVRTPLNIISGFAQIIADGDFNMSPETRADIAKRITKSSNDIVRIINELLDISGKECINHIEKADLVSCNEICQKAIDSSRHALPEGVEMRLVTDLKDSFRFQTNKNELLKLLDCLLNNACKFTEQGFITTYCQMNKDEQQLNISITDTGCGVPHTESEKIFNHFYKVNNYKAGVGMGLPLARNIARQLGGDVRLDNSARRKGASFIVTLPLN
jgi:signal transduction histidine kinase